MINKGLKVQKLKGSKVLLLLTFLTFQLFNFSNSLAGKPRGPLELSFSVDPSPSIGAVVGLTLTVTARVDSPDLAISVELPEGLPHVEGPLHWRGAATGGQPVSVSIEVGPLSAQPAEVIGRATVTLPPGPGQANGSTWTQATSILLEPTLPPEAEKPLPRLRQDRQGQSILEIPIK